LSFDEDIRFAARLLAEAVPFPVLTGAGISVESGVPPFTGPGGLWTRYDPYEYGHIDTFLIDPMRSWTLLMELLEGSLGASPNDAHRSLSVMEDKGWVRPVITQNVDGLHSEAGSKDVLELHGNIRRIKCMKCGNLEVLDASALDTFQKVCFCGGVKKPDVVLYGENLPYSVLIDAQEACSACKAVLVVGTSGLVQPAASLPMIVHERGGKVVEVNPSDTSLSGGYADITIRAGAVKGLTALLDAMTGLLG